jgi:hypothetical protein
MGGSWGRGINLFVVCQKKIDGKGYENGWIYEHVKDMAYVFWHWRAGLGWYIHVYITDAYLVGCGICKSICIRFMLWDIMLSYELFVLCGVGAIRM